jgi:uncharacterized protein
MKAGATTSVESGLSNDCGGRGQHLQPIRAMTQPGFYLRSAGDLQVSQTLTSRLLFAGDFVYKIKRSLRLAFVDALTPAKRYQLCHEEVRLGRRFAPGVYIGVVGMRKRNGRYEPVPDNLRERAQLYEFAVLMRRLPRELMMDQMVADGRLSNTIVRDLAKKLAMLHAGGSAARSKLWGSPTAVSRLVMSNLREAEALAADSITRGRLTAVKDYAGRQFAPFEQTLDRRVRAGRIREGHGDLRCDAVCFAPDGLAIIDCVEGDEGLRYTDIASELASLAVDLDLLERSDLGDELLNAYMAETGDKDAWGLFRFYRSYRAALRGKLALIESLQRELPMKQRILARSSAARCFALAQAYACA